MSDQITQAEIEKIRGDMNAGMNALGRDAGPNPQTFVSTKDLKSLISLAEKGLKMEKALREIAQKDGDGDPVLRQDEMYFVACLALAQETAPA